MQATNPMKVKFSLRGEIAEDFMKSNYKNPHDFLAEIQHQTPLCRNWEGDLFAVAYLKDQQSHLPKGIPFTSGV